MPLVLFVITLAVTAPWATTQADKEPVPAYNAGPPAKGANLPPILSPDQLSGDDASYRREARAALELDRRMPHEDKKLPDTLRWRLEAAEKR